MRPPRHLAIAVAAAIFTLPVTLTACGHRAAQARWSEPSRAPSSTAAGSAGTGTGTTGGGASPTAGTASGAGTPGGDNPGPAQGRAPTTTFAVGVRQLHLQRGADRPLPTTVWYPATGKAGAAAGAGAGAAANGHFPVVLFSHGLTGIPTAYEGILTRLAAAGFVVAAPAYPYTKQGAPSYNPLDVLNQPADAWYVIGEVLKLNTRSGDPLAGHLDPSRVGLAGHSAGAYTTAGMLTARREAPVAGAVIIAGGSIGGFAGTATPVLYVHGDQDPTVGIANGRAAYAATPWPKAFVTVVGGGHWQYLAPGAPGFAATVATTTDFLRWTLYGDDAAKARIAGDGSRDGAVRTETALG